MGQVMKDFESQTEDFIFDPGGIIESLGGSLKKSSKNVWRRFFWKKFIAFPANYFEGNNTFFEYKLFT